MATDNVKAVWAGPAGYALQVTGEELIPGETVVEIPAGEAEASAHWQPLERKTEPTVPELRARADELGVDVPKGTKKAELQALIAEAEAQADTVETAAEGDAEGDAANAAETVADQPAEETA